MTGERTAWSHLQSTKQLLVPHLRFLFFGQAQQHSLRKECEEIIISLRFYDVLHQAAGLTEIFYCFLNLWDLIILPGLLSVPSSKFYSRNFMLDMSIQLRIV